MEKLRPREVKQLVKGHSQTETKNQSLLFPGPGLLSLHYVIIMSGGIRRMNHNNMHPYYFHNIPTFNELM